MIKGIRLASVWSEDLSNLLPFYRDVLGLSVGMEVPGFVILGDPNAPALALGTHSEVHGHASDPHRHMVGFETDDVAGEFARLKERGVEFIEEPAAADEGGVSTATLKDPEGNLVQLFQFSRPL